MHICGFVLCLVIVLWALIHLTEFALNEGNWQVGRKKPNVAKSPIKETARGQPGPKIHIRENVIMMLHFKRHLKRDIMKDRRKVDYRGEDIGLPSLSHKDRYNEVQSFLQDFGHLNSKHIQS